MESINAPIDRSLSKPSQDGRRSMAQARQNNIAGAPTFYRSGGSADTFLPGCTTNEGPTGNMLQASEQANFPRQRAEERLWDGNTMAFRAPSNIRRRAALPQPQPRNNDTAVQEPASQQQGLSLEERTARFLSRRRDRPEYAARMKEMEAWARQEGHLRTQRPQPHPGSARSSLIEKAENDGNRSVLQPPVREGAESSQPTFNQDHPSETPFGDDAATPLFFWKGQWYQPISHGLLPPLAADDGSPVRDIGSATSSAVGRATLEALEVSQPGRLVPQHQQPATSVATSKVPKRKSVGDEGDSSAREDGAPVKKKPRKYGASSSRSLRALAKAAKHQPALTSAQPTGQYLQPHQAPLGTHISSSSSAIQQPSASSAINAHLPFPWQVDPLPGQFRIPAPTPRSQRGNVPSYKWDNEALFSHLSDDDIFAGALNPGDVSGKRLRNMSRRHRNKVLTEKMDALWLRLGGEKQSKSNIATKVRLANNWFADQEGISREQAWNDHVQARDDNGVRRTHTARSRQYNIHTRPLQRVSEESDGASSMATPATETAETTDSNVSGESSTSSRLQPENGLTQTPATNSNSMWTAAELAATTSHNQETEVTPYHTATSPGDEGYDFSAEGNAAPQDVSNGLLELDAMGTTPNFPMQNVTDADEGELNFDTVLNSFNFSDFDIDSDKFYHAE